MKTTNNFFMQNDKIFNRACSLADIPATTRQASKFRRKKGRAYQFKSGAIKIEKKKAAWHH